MTLPCSGKTVLFFSTAAESVAQAQDACRCCPKQAECLERAIGRRESFGVWGGTTPEDRRHLVAGRAAA